MDVIDAGQERYEIIGTSNLIIIILVVVVDSYFLSCQILLYPHLPSVAITNQLWGGGGREDEDWNWRE